MGKKYVVEIPEDKITDFVGSTHFLMPYMMAGHIGHHDTGLPIEPYTEPDLEQVREKAYMAGFKDGEENAYQRGMDDANRNGEYNADDGWYVMQKISLLPNPIKTELFGTAETAVILQGNSFKDALAKLAEYEQRQEEQIRVGDEVTPRETEYDDMIVTRLWKDDYDSDCIDAIGFDGRIGSFLVSRVSKTGKHYEIAEVLAKMKETDNG